jgi:hypothetical protein
MLEFGSENNTGTDLAPSMARIDEQLDFIGQYKDNIVFFVTQTGSFTQHTQVGSFDIDFTKLLAKKIHDAGFLFKEHNADYLTHSDVKLRGPGGVDALNIAPQLGTIQTKILKELSNNSIAWQDFAKIVYNSNLWTKWIPKNINDPALAVIVAGHYMFNTPQYKQLMSTIDKELFMVQLKKELIKTLDVYTGGNNDTAH